ncbi:zinc finger protein 225-like [Malaya genurostris]|uniref:zinc finger protein 225-like n=1 Tax=Malaya genurostris TaxID=325434 RepID=UPI0026F3E322|nr:zinc finger protein 225-like [Malaya genurostris]
MSCAVPSCAGLEKHLVPFPVSTNLQTRWEQAIRAGTGLDFSMRHGESVCSWHFSHQPAINEYWEPFRFLHRNGKTVHVSSCRLCLRFDDQTRMISKEVILGEPEHSTVIKNVLKIRLTKSDLLSDICGDCVKRIDLLVDWIRDAEKIEADYRHFESAANYSIDMTLRDTYPSSNSAGFKLIDMQVEPIEIKEELVESLLENADELVVKRIDQTVSDLKVDKKSQTKVKALEKTVKYPPNVASKRGRKPRQNLGEKKEIINYRDILSRKCYICNQVLEDLEELVAHLTKIHSFGKNHKCSVCNKSFKLITSLNRHLSLHDETNRPLKCSFCPVGYKFKYSLLVHENRVHNAGHRIRKKKKSTVIKFQCSTCGETFRTNYEFLNHDRIRHQLLPGTTCKLCGKNFHSRSSLRKHQIVHLQDKPYDCPHCDVAFKNTTNLMNHVARKHGLQKDSTIEHKDATE